MLGVLTSKQLSEWEVYDRLDPTGEWRDDFRLAYLSSLLTNLTISVYGKQGAKTTNPMDFMLEWDLEKREPKKQSREEIKAALKGISDFVNRKAKEKEKKSNLDLTNRPPRRFRQTNNPKL